MRVHGIVVHCSASTFGDAQMIAAWHKERGFDTIGYHGVILNGVLRPQDGYQELLDGAVEPGRPHNVQGAHCRARGMNALTLGVCLIGHPQRPGFVGQEIAPAGPDRVMARPYATRKQVRALIDWIARACVRHNLDPRGVAVARGREWPVVTQHSDHDPGKPLCASINPAVLAKEVERHLREAL